MAQMTNYLENELYDHVFRNAAYTSPAAIYLALFTTATGEAGGGTEVSGGGYARQAITMGAPTDGAGSNSAPIVFGPASASWGTVTHFAVFDASVGGNMLLYGELTTTPPGGKLVEESDTMTFATGDLDLAFQ